MWSDLVVIRSNTPASRLARAAEIPLFLLAPKVQRTGRQAAVDYGAAAATTAQNPYVPPVATTAAQAPPAATTTNAYAPPGEIHSLAWEIWN